MARRRKVPRARPPEGRRSSILEWIEQQGTGSLAELSRALNVSEMTIRRDLEALERGGMIRRIRGGAISTRGRSYEPPYLTRAVQASQAKQHIGDVAARMVVDGDSLALDTGTTTFEVARRLVGRRNLTIVTPSLRIANLLAGQPDIRLILSGGIVRPGEASMVGELPRQAFRGLFVDKLFLGVGCIDAGAGLTEYNWDDTLVKQAMIRSAKRVIVVADASKFGKIAFAHVAPLEAMHVLVTDAAPPATLRERLNAVGVKVVVAGDGRREHPDGEGGNPPGTMTREGGGVRPERGRSAAP
jgi:DeoR/GlpR family transcriptional regulator of sugar metabolism